MRWFILLVSVAIAGCGDAGGLFRPHVAAIAAGQALTVDHLAHWIAALKRRGIRSSHFEAIAAVYVDDALFAVAAASGRDLDDSALVLAARWPAVAQLRWTKLREAFVRARAPLTPSEVDSAYRDGRVRLMQHLLLRLSADPSPDTVAKTQARAEGLRRAIVAARGANFSALARRFSDDRTSRTSGGYLSVGTREEFLDPFNTVAWSLAPGEVSAVVRSPFGFHVIRRPPLAEVRDAFAAGLAHVVAAHEDSVHMARLAATKHVTVEGDGPALVRQLFTNVLGARTDPHWVVRFDGGGLRVADLSRWLLALNPSQVALLPSATDAQLQQFLQVVAARELVLAEADSAGISLSPTEWQALRAQHDSSIRELEVALGVPSVVSADETPEARRALAGAHVLAYLDRTFDNRVAFVPVPPLLAAVLRDSATWSISRRGVAAAAVRADQLLAAGGTPPPLTPGSQSTGHGSAP